MSKSNNIVDEVYEKETDQRIDVDFGNTDSFKTLIYRQFLKQKYNVQNQFLEKELMSNLQKVSISDNDETPKSQSIIEKNSVFKTFELDLIWLTNIKFPRENGSESKTKNPDEQFLRPSESDQQTIYLKTKAFDFVQKDKALIDKKTYATEFFSKKGDQRNKSYYLIGKFYEIPYALFFLDSQPGETILEQKWQKMNIKKHASYLIWKRDFLCKLKYEAFYDKVVKLIKENLETDKRIVALSTKVKTKKSNKPIENPIDKDAMIKTLNGLNIEYSPYLWASTTTTNALDLGKDIKWNERASEAREELTKYIYFSLPFENQLLEFFGTTYFVNYYTIWNSIVENILKEKGHKTPSLTIENGSQYSIANQKPLTFSKKLPNKILDFTINASSLGYMRNGEVFDSDGDKFEVDIKFLPTTFTPNDTILLKIWMFYVIKWGYPKSIFDFIFLGNNWQILALVITRWFYNKNIY